MMNPDLYKLQTLVENFKNKIIGDKEPVRHKCFCISYPLSLYLQINGYHNSLKGGNFKCPINEPNLEYPRNHTWIVLNNGTIVDATIEQFSKYLSVKKLPLIFSNFETNKIEDYLSVHNHRNWFVALENKDEWLKEALGNFKSCFENPLAYLGEENIRKAGFDLRDFLRISLKAAIVLNNEIDKRRIDVNHINRTDTKEYLTYFDFICYMLIVSNNTGLSLVISEFENNEDYHNLISKIQSIQID